VKQLDYAATSAKSCRLHCRRRSEESETESVRGKRQGRFGNFALREVFLFTH